MKSLKLALAFALLATGGNAQTILNLPAATTISPADALGITQVGTPNVSKKVTVQQLRTAPTPIAGSGVTVLGGALTTDTTMLTVPPTNGVWFSGGPNVSFCPQLSCAATTRGSPTNDHQRAVMLISGTTQDDGHSEEQMLAVHTTINKGQADQAWAASHNYASGTNLQLQGVNAVFRQTTAGSCISGGSQPGFAYNGGPYTDGTCTWTWINASAIDAKAGIYNETASLAGGGASWAQANNIQLQPGFSPRFAANTEFDFTNNSGTDCVIGIYCVGQRVQMGGNNLSTSAIDIVPAWGNGTPSGGAGAFATNWGLRLSGHNLSQYSDFQIDSDAPYAIGINNTGFGPRAHSGAAIQDASTTPASYDAGGTYGYSAFTTVNSKSPTALGAALGQSTCYNGLRNCIRYGDQIYGTISNGGTVMTGVSSPFLAAVGQTITGTGVPSATTITNISGSTITLSKPVTQASSSAVPYYLDSGHYTFTNSSSGNVVATLGDDGRLTLARDIISSAAIFSGNGWIDACSYLWRYNFGDPTCTIDTTRKSKSHFQTQYQSQFDSGTFETNQQLELYTNTGGDGSTAGKGKVNLSSLTMVDAGAGSTWDHAQQMELMAGWAPNALPHVYFAAMQELDLHNMAKACIPGGSNNCNAYGITIVPYGKYTSTTGINIAAGAGATYNASLAGDCGTTPAHCYDYGLSEAIRIQGDWLTKNSDIITGTKAPKSLDLNGTHSLATVYDLSTSPVSYSASGTYSAAAFDARNAITPNALLTANGQAIGNSGAGRMVFAITGYNNLALYGGTTSASGIDFAGSGGTGVGSLTVSSSGFTFTNGLIATGTSSAIGFTAAGTYSASAFDARNATTPNALLTATGQAIGNDGAGRLVFAASGATNTSLYGGQAGASGITFVGNAGAALATLTVTSSVASFNVPVSATSYSVGGGAGVSCAAGTVSLATLVVTSGIITHC